ncbi:MAG: LPS export ABC transporter permease LptG [Desulfobacteraceae bacterium]|nr:LPS export ABC transporter permease LptG [Desulfobacteraceae bacterium]
MPIINRYLIRNIIKYFLLILLTVIVIYVFIDFIEKSGKFVKADLPATRILLYFLYNIPFIASLVTPIAVLLSVLIVLALMGKDNEILALKTSGVSLFSLLKPILLFGILISVFLFLISESIVPAATSAATRIWLKEVKKKNISITSKQRNIWIKGHRQITHIKFYNPADRTVSHVSVNFFDRDFNPVRRIDAQGGSFDRDHWILNNLMELRMDASSHTHTIEYLKQQAFDLNFYPEDLSRVVKKSQEMNILELREYVNKVETEGYDATAYRVDMQGKAALPIACVIMCIIGLGIATRNQAKDGVAVSASFGLILAFLYWTLYSFCMSLGYGEKIPPFLAAWSANIMFLCFGGYILLNSE